MVAFMSTSFLNSVIKIFFFDLPTLKLIIIIIIFPTNRPEFIPSTARRTKN